jgi:hypothetical protein
MEDLKIYGISFFALMTSMSTVNPVLQAIVLTLTIVYTAIGIYKRLKNKNNEST